MRQFTFSIDFGRVIRIVRWLVIIGLLLLLCYNTATINEGVWATYICCMTGGVFGQPPDYVEPQVYPMAQTYVTEGMEELELIVKLRKDVKDLRTDVDNLTRRVEDLEK